MRIKETLIILAIVIFVLSGSVFAWEAPYDFEGETVEIASYLTQWGYEWEEGEDKEHLELVEDKFNVNIEFVHTDMGAWELLPEDVLAGEIPFDIGFMQTGLVAQYYEYMLPLDDYIDEMNLFERTPDVGLLSSRENQPIIYDQVYGLEKLSTAFRPPIIWWNKDLFDEEGVKTPYEYIEEDDWTWENFLDVATQFTKDTDGDGEIDQWGIGSNDLTGYHGDSLFREQAYVMPQNNGTSPVIYEDGEYVFNGKDPAFIEALEFRREIYEADVETLGEVDADEEFQAGNIAMMGRHGSQNYGEEEDFHLGLAYYPRGPQVEEHVFPVRTGNAMYLPLTVDRDPEKLIELFLALFQRAEPYIDNDDFEANFEDTLMEMWGDVLHDRKAAEILVEIISNATWDFSHEMTNVENEDEELILPLTIADVITGDLSPEAAMEEVEPEIQAHLDENYN